jgi:ribonucleoside-diphosphate reductase alpha chain
MMKRRVLFKKKDGEQETPQDAYQRVAKFVATGHAKFSPSEAKRFENQAYEMMSEGKFMPNTPVLVNAGFPNAQCSACFVIPIEDNLRSIYKAHTDQGLIQSSGGGFGASFSNIRSAGTTTSSGRFITKGPISWLRMFNENAGHVTQGMRDGANMANLDIGHPNIKEFITCKSRGYGLVVDELAEQFNVSVEEAARIKSVIGIEKFNLSVSITNKFMETLERSGDWYLIDPHTKQHTKTAPAKELWDLIVNSAHQHGEPGVFFIDRANEKQELSHVGRIIGTNACGEVPALPNSSCTLGHINLSKFVSSGGVDWIGLEDAIRFGVQFLDDIVDLNTFPVLELAEMNANARQIGLGVMRWADALIKSGIQYDSEAAIELANSIGQFLDKITFDESAKLGKSRGNYPYFEGSSTQKAGQRYMRNGGRTTIAPTGQTSMYAGCSSGIEPLMFPVMRREQAGMIQVDYHPILFQTLKDRGLDTPEIREKLGILGSVRKAAFLPQDIRDLFPCAQDIHYTWHVKHQAAWQHHITFAVSKTINFPKDAPVSDVSDAYLLAYKSGCKGITVYRDGSRIGQPLSSMREKDQKIVKIKNKRSEVTYGTNRKIPTGCGNLMVYCGGQTDHDLQDITARLGKSGGCSSSMLEALARLSSIAVQHGVPPELIVKQMSGIRCSLTAFYHSKYTGDKSRTITSCPDALSVAIQEYLLNGSGRELEAHDKMVNHTGACPDCGGQLMYQEGCSKCICGWSRCS